ncbi:acetyl-coenzyme A synthetase 2 [Binucleata daphniae]
MYEKSICNRDEFYSEQAKKLLTWDTMFEQVTYENFDTCEFKWFIGGKLNACYNALDRHVKTNPKKIALIYDGNDGEKMTYTYQELLTNVLKVANLLKSKNLKMNDCVTIYMPVVPETFFVALACSRLGLIHNFVFGGFSSSSLAWRIEDSKSTFLITVDQIRRGDMKINFLENALEAAKEINEPIDILVFSMNSTKVCQNENVIYYHNECLSDAFLPCVPVDSEYPLFYMYTSGSTGKPKGIVHTTGGYLLSTLLSTKYIFDFSENDVFFCTADMGWLAAGSHSLYGPLCLGGTTIVFGGTPVYPDYFRLFKIINDYGCTHLYTAPTVIRILLRHFKNMLCQGNQDYSEESIKSKYPMKNLKIIGSVGEPLNYVAYQWYKTYFNNLPIIDTYWQTESGAVMLCPMLGTSEKPMSVGLPFFGMKPYIVRDIGDNEVLYGSQAKNMNKYELMSENSDNKENESKDETVSNVNRNINEQDNIIIGNNGKKYIVCQKNEPGILIFKGQWPSVVRTILNDPERYKQSYWHVFNNFYYTGDMAICDNDGMYFIMGRSDDVLNVSGHRLSTTQIENVVSGIPGIVEVAVVPADDEITGQAIIIYALKSIDYEISDETLAEKIKFNLRKKIGRIVHPKKILFVEDLPKTRTGKIMRRILRGVYSGNDYGDVSACANIESLLKLQGKQ